jgi:glutaredoxin-dependent peroxiredoxin
MLMALGIGAVAPDFNLMTKDRAGLREIRLSSHRGQENVVLLFFPGAFTSVCRDEMCSVSGGLDDWKALNAVVYGISPDSVFALEEWANSCGIGVTLLADYQREAAKAYDVEWENFAGMGKGCARAVFVINKKGIILHSEQTPNLGDMPDLEAVDQLLQAIS